ncbi:MAG: hypothetical protein EXR51_06980 [Dehalococcoidia bacterium]|nr:hypothetical protein [Dehalococcoidia bacterium]
MLDGATMERQLPLTPQREAVLEVVRGPRPSNSRADYQRVRRRMLRLSCGSAHDALAALAKQGEVPAPSFGDGASRYDGRNDRHDHSRCLGCGPAGRHQKPKAGDVDRRSGSTAGVPLHQATY